MQMASRPSPCMSRNVSIRSEEHTSELQSLRHLVCRLLLEKKKHEIRRKSTTVETASIEQKVGGYGTATKASLGDNGIRCARSTIPSDSRRLTNELQTDPPE